MRRGLRFAGASCQCSRGGWSTARVALIPSALPDALTEAQEMIKADRERAARVLVPS